MRPGRSNVDGKTRGRGEERYISIASAFGRNFFCAFSNGPVTRFFRKPTKRGHAESNVDRVVRDRNENPFCPIAFGRQSLGFGLREGRARQFKPFTERDGLDFSQTAPVNRVGRPDRAGRTESIFGFETAFEHGRFRLWVRRN